MPEPKKKPAVKISIIQPEGPQPKGDPYRVLTGLVMTPDHEHLVRAKIALAWHHGWTADPDGHIKLGKARKVGEADRQLHGFDFVILLNKRVWDRLDFTDAQIEALLDHELMHCDVQRDEDGEVKEDERGRPIWRIRKHDLEEFSAIVARHGCWKCDLEAFVKTALRRQPSLFADVPSAAAGEAAMAGKPAAKADEYECDHVCATCTRNGDCEHQVPPAGRPAPKGRPKMRAKAGAA